MTHPHRPVHQTRGMTRHPTDDVPTPPRSHQRKTSHPQTHDRKYVVPESRKKKSPQVVDGIQGEDGLEANDEEAIQFADSTNNTVALNSAAVSTIARQLRKRQRPLSDFGQEDGRKKLRTVAQPSLTGRAYAALTIEQERDHYWERCLHDFSKAMQHFNNVHADCDDLGLFPGDTFLGLKWSLYRASDAKKPLTLKEFHALEDDDYQSSSCHTLFLTADEARDFLKDGRPAKNIIVPGLRNPKAPLCRPIEHSLHMLAGYEKLATKNPWAMVEKDNEIPEEILEQLTRVPQEQLAQASRLWTQGLSIVNPGMPRFNTCPPFLVDLEVGIFSHTSERI